MNPMFFFVTFLVLIMNLVPSIIAHNHQNVHAFHTHHRQPRKYIQVRRKHHSRKKHIQRKTHWKTQPVSSSFSSQCLNQHNTYRRNQGVRTLRWDSNLANGALHHSKSENSRNTFNHASVYGFSENMYKGYITSGSCGDAVNAWQYSQGHAQNMVAYGATRVGCGRGGGIVTCRKQFYFFTLIKRLCLTPRKVVI